MVPLKGHHVPKGALLERHRVTVRRTGPEDPQLRKHVKRLHGLWGVNFR